MVSDGIIAALDGYRDLRDRSLEQIFLAIYGSPLLQAMVGLGASDEPPRRGPALEPERIAFIQQRIAELKARVAEGGPREAAIRSLVYIGMAGPGVDERAFNELRQIRAENEGLTLEAFKQIAARAVLQPAARPRRRARRDSEDAAGRRREPAQQHRWRRSAQVASAAGESTGERARAAGADRRSCSRGRRKSAVRQVRAKGAVALAKVRGKYSWSASTRSTTA